MSKWDLFYKMSSRKFIARVVIGPKIKDTQNESWIYKENQLVGVTRICNSAATIRTFYILYSRSMSDYEDKELQKFVLLTFNLLKTMQ